MLKNIYFFTLGNLCSHFDNINHTLCEQFTVNNQTYYYCGKDLRYGDAPYDATGVYATHLYTDKAINIARKHAQLRPDKVKHARTVGLS